MVCVSRRSALEALRSLLLGANEIGEHSVDIERV